LADAEKVKPRLRGVSHYIGFYVALALSLALFFSPRTGIAYVGGLVYAGSVVLLFGLSGMYHRLTWSRRARRIFRQLDHSGIFFLIAGSYTAFWTLSPEGVRSVWSIWVMWGSAIFGIVAFVAWTDMHRALRAAVYVVLGLSTLPHAFKLPELFGWTTTLLVLGGGVVYILGAVVYARRWPNPDPKVFGYHEVFHLMVILAAGLQFTAVFALHWAS
jgi:hemolysin III